MYYLMFLVPLTLHPLKISNRLKGILNSIALGAMAIFRFGAGADYFSYSLLYYDLPNKSIMNAISTLKDQEIGMKLLMFPFRYFSLPYELFVGFSAIVMMVLMFLWIDKNVKSVSLAYLVYYTFFFLVWNMSALRQGMALTIGCYLLFNIKYQWKFYQKLIIVGCLFFIHKTSIFYLLFLLGDFVKWDRTKLIYFVLASLLISVLPLAGFATLIIKIPIFSRVAVYLISGNVSFGFWDIKSIPRLFLIVVVLFHYNSLIKRELIQQRFLNSFIIGVSFFFVLRFDDLIGARISIYGFFLAILILPSVLELYNQRKIITVMAYTSFTLMCSLYLQKELMTMAKQAGIKTLYKYYVPYHSIFQEKSVSFSTNYYFANNYSNFTDINKCKLEMEQYFTSSVLVKSEMHEPSEYLAVRFQNGLFGLIDTEGNVVLEGKFNSIEYFDGIIRTSSGEYYNTRGVELEMQSAAKLYILKKGKDIADIALNLKWIDDGSNHPTYEVYRDLELETKLKYISFLYQKDPLSYKIVHFFSNKYGSIYRFYNPNMKLLTQDFFLDAENILSNRVVLAKNVCGTKYYNESGKMIWMELD